MISRDKLDAASQKVDYHAGSTRFDSVGSGLAAIAWGLVAVAESLAMMGRGTTSQDEDEDDLR